MKILVTALATALIVTTAYCQKTGGIVGHLPQHTEPPKVEKKVCTPHYKVVTDTTSEKDGITAYYFYCDEDGKVRYTVSESYSRKGIWEVWPVAKQAYGDSLHYESFVDQTSGMASASKKTKDDYEQADVYFIGGGTSAYICPAAIYPTKWNTTGFIPSTTSTFHDGAGWKMLGDRSLW